LVRRGASSLTDPLAFLVGKYLSVEILGVITPSGHKRVFGVEHSYIQEKISPKDVQEKWFPKIMNAYQTEASPYLQRCFTDYRLALEHAEDTGFYCFRAIESLRQFFNEQGDKNRSWKKLRDATNTDRDTIEENIQEYSKNRRHGDVYLITGEERKLVLETTWDIITGFIEYVDEKLEQTDPQTDTSTGN